MLLQIFCGGSSNFFSGEDHGMDVEIFCCKCETGWDFDLQEQQDIFIERLRTEMPDENLLGSLMPSVESDAKSGY